MIQLTFVTDKTYVLQHVLKSFVHKKDFNQLKYILWERNKNLYYILSQNVEPLIFSNDFSMAFNASPKKITGDLAYIYNTLYFKKIFRETEKYAIDTENQWHRNYKASISHLDNITRLKPQKINLNLKVYVSHPELSNGRSYPDHKIITWGHNEDWNNYSTVYLWHEIMHHITYKWKSEPNVMHALIELACDNELRVRLNRKGVYFKEGKFKVGHKSLLKIEKKIYNEWSKYLKNYYMNLRQFEKRLRAKLPRKTLAKQSKLDFWSEWH